MNIYVTSLCCPHLISYHLIRPNASCFVYILISRSKHQSGKPITRSSTDQQTSGNSQRKDQRSPAAHQSKQVSGIDEAPAWGIALNANTIETLSDKIATAVQSIKQENLATMVIRSELSDYEDPRDLFRDEWLGSCEHAPDGSYFAVPEFRQASSPVSGYMPGIDVEVSVTPVRLQQDSGDASVSAVDVTSGPEVDFLDPPPPLLSGFGDAAVASPGR